MFAALMEMVVETFAHEDTHEEEVVTLAIVDTNGVHYMN